MRLQFLEDASKALGSARTMLMADPIRNNLILTLLTGLSQRSQPGRFWVAEEGVVFHNPATRPAVLSYMRPDYAASMCDSIADTDAQFPGVNGAAECAATFAGQWAERRKVPATPERGLRLYQLAELADRPTAPGHPRLATVADRELMIDWVRAFDEEVHEPGSGREEIVDRWLARDLVWLWDDNGPVSMTGFNSSVAGTSRIGPVYTPPDLRGHGYAGALVHAVSSAITDRGETCVLYTDLGNPVSNSIYRRLGYRAVMEAIHYRFGTAESWT